MQGGLFSTCLFIFAAGKGRTMRASRGNGRLNKGHSVRSAGDLQHDHELSAVAAVVANPNASVWCIWRRLVAVARYGGPCHHGFAHPAAEVFRVAEVPCVTLSAI